MELRPEVAEQFELTMGVTRVHVPQLGRDYDLTRISLEEAEQLVAVPGFDRLRRKQVPVKRGGAGGSNHRPRKGKKKESLM
jgi:hypothetical protein